MKALTPNDAVPIPGYDNYWITRDGRVFSGYTWNGKVVGEIKPKIVKPPKRHNSTGYLRYSLQRDGKQKSMLLHRLLAIAFIPNPNEYPQVNHKDGNKLNNNLDNLEWCNNSYNVKHAYNSGLNQQIEGIAHHRSKPVLQIKNGEIVSIWSNSRRAALVLGYCQHNITAVCRGVRNTYKGYNWQFITKIEYCQRAGIDLYFKKQGE